MAAVMLWRQARGRQLLQAQIKPVSDLCCAPPRDAILLGTSAWVGELTANLGAQTAAEPASHACCRLTAGSVDAR